MRWGIYVTLIVGLISFYNAHGQIEPDATTDYTIFNEIDSLNTVALMQLKVNLSSAKETAKKANHLALQNNRIQAYIQSTCILSKMMANTTHCREALEILKQAELQAVKESNSLGMGLLASPRGNVTIIWLFMTPQKFSMKMPSIYFNELMKIPGLLLNTFN